MRLELDAPAGAVTFDDDGSMVRGVAVPYGELGLTSAGLVRFLPGSLPVDVTDRDAPVPLVLDHDLTRPIGVVHELVDDGRVLRFAARLDPIPDADHARAQMRSRSRPGVSVGVDVLAHSIDPDGVLDVHAAEWVELSSVVRPAFAPAQIAAARAALAPTTVPDGEESTMTDPTTAELVEPDLTAASKPKATPPPEDPPARVPAHVTRSSGNVTVAPTLRAMFAGMMADLRASGIGSAHDVRAALDAHANAQLRAALVDVTTTHLPPVGTWVAELDNFMREGMPVVSAFDTRTVDRWPVYQRQIKTLPDAGVQSAEKTAINTGAVALEWAELGDSTYAHGNDVSVQAIEDNGEQVLADLSEIVGETIGRKIDAHAVAAIDSAAQTGPATGPTLDNVGGAIGAVAATGRAGSGIVVVCAPDAYGKLWALTAAGGPSLDRFVGLTERPTVVASPDVASGVAYVGARSAFRTYLGPLANLRAVVVDLLGLNVGTYRRAGFRIVDAAALVKITSA